MQPPPSPSSLQPLSDLDAPADVTRPAPVALSDQQMDAVFAAAHPLPADRRSDFLADVVRELARLPMLGDGSLHRVVMTVQRRHFDPPDFTHHRGRHGKYDHG